jgi:aspartate/methionine/tyrosine aminotransferase
MGDDKNNVTLLKEAARLARIDSFIVMDMMRAAAAREAAGLDVIHMEVGQPATPAPRVARDAVRAALESDTLGYTMALGIQPLRERIARHYEETYGVRIAADRIVVTTGSSAAFILAFLSVFNPGDRVALPAPGYPCYRQILSALGQTPVSIETGPDTRWMLTADDVERAHHAGALSGLLIASPANPTGTMLDSTRLAELTRTCKKLGLWFISDEIYHGLTYGMPATTALQHDDDAIVINSFSKYFSMTGWRVGWMVVPERLVRPVERLAQNLYISPPTVSQVAALAAFDAREELQQNVEVYAANRELLVAELPKAGFDKLAPADGAFYIYADVSRFTNDSVAFAKAMLDEIGVAVTPGVDFDAKHGHNFIRFSYAGATARMREAALRLAEWPRLRPAGSVTTPRA